MTLSDQFLTLIAFPLCFVIQLVTIDEVLPVTLDCNPQHPLM